MAVSGKLEGTTYSNDHRASFTNCYETKKSGYSSPGITTISEEKLKSGEIAYKLNGDRSDGTWGQVIGTEDYPHFRKYSKTVYYDSSYSVHILIIMRQVSLPQLSRILRRFLTQKRLLHLRQQELPEQRLSFS